MLYTKSVHSNPEAKDGLRILAARFRGRGLSADRYDVWMANLAPSEKLLRAFLAEEISWAVFSKSYKQQLFADAALDSENRTIRNHGQKFTLRLLKHLSQAGNVTVMCHCPEDTTQCHRFLLKSVVESKKV
jgi:uncharacterized protein YeaO (DUF488 family)